MRRGGGADYLAQHSSSADLAETYNMDEVSYITLGRPEKYLYIICILDAPIHTVLLTLIR